MLNEPMVLIVTACVAFAAVTLILHAVACSVRNEVLVWDVRNKCQALVYRQQIEILEEIDRVQREKNGTSDDDTGDEVVGVDIVEDEPSPVGEPAAV